MSGASAHSDSHSGRANGKSENAFLTISEVAEELDVQQHVLRFWETKFNQIKPMKRGGGRRYYRPADVELLKLIQFQLYQKGYTIRGVQKLFREQGLKNVMADWQNELNGEAPENAVETSVSSTVSVDQSVLKDVLTELKSLRAALGD